MSHVIPHILSTGGSIHLLYAKGGSKGVSNPNTLSFRVEIDPASSTPLAELILELPGDNSHFRFSDNSRYLTKDLDYVKDGEVRNEEFTITCSIPNPPGSMELRVHTRNKSAPDGVTDMDIVIYNVKVTITTQEDIKAAFVSKPPITKSLH